MLISIFGEKLGTTALFNANNAYKCVTLVKLFPAKVCEVKTITKNGYNALKIVTGSVVKEKNLSKPQKSYLQKHSLPLRRKQYEIRFDTKKEEEGENEGDYFDGISIGYEINNPDAIATLVGAIVDVEGITQGKGFAGPMKRHGFKGLGASHGESVAHRSHGSTGNRQDPGRVFKNKKMAGHMGQVKTTIKNLKIVGYNKEDGILIIEGSLPGSIGSNVIIKNASNFRANVNYGLINGIDIASIKTKAA
jgi:large subunit ribosomal protein L3